MEFLNITYIFHINAFVVLLGGKIITGDRITFEKSEAYFEKSRAHHMMMMLLAARYLYLSIHFHV